MRQRENAITGRASPTDATAQTFTALLPGFVELASGAACTPCLPRLNLLTGRFAATGSGYRWNHPHTKVAHKHRRLIAITVSRRLWGAVLMTPYVRPFLSKSFYKPDIARAAASAAAPSPSSAPLPSLSPPVPSSPRAQTASKPVFFGEPHYVNISLSEMMTLEGFPECQRQYMALLDGLAAFVDTRAGQMQPPLLDKTKARIKADINALKTHLTNQNENYFGPHKPVIYGAAKELFHELDQLLANRGLSLERRMLAVQELDPVWACVPEASSQRCKTP